MLFLISPGFRTVQNGDFLSDDDDGMMTMMMMLCIIGYIVQSAGLCFKAFFMGKFELPIPSSFRKGIIYGAKRTYFNQLI